MESETPRRNALPYRGFFVGLYAVILATCSLVAADAEVYFYRMSSLSSDSKKPGCYMTFTDQEGLKLPKGSKIGRSSGVPCTILRNGEEIGTMFTDKVRNEFTDYDVVPGETYTYEIRGYDGAYSATTGEKNITCNFIYGIDLGTRELSFEADNNTPKNITYSLYKQTVSGKEPISTNVSCTPSDDWINVETTKGVIAIWVEPNESGSARGGTATINSSYTGSSYPIRIVQMGKEDAYTVKYHKNDPNGGADVTRGQNIPVGETKRLLYLDSALKWAIKDEGGFSYIFLGWAKSPTGSAVYANGEQVRDLVAKGKVLHLYAVWQKRAYQVVFHSNDGTDSASQEFRPGIAKNLLWLDSGLGWTRSGYDFLGWAKSPTSTAVVYKNGQNVNNIAAMGEKLHLYAVWRDRRWTIRYHRNYSSADGEYVDHKIPVGASVKLYWLDSQLGWTRDGYWFKGWAKSRTAGTAYQNGQTVKDLVPGGQVLHIYGAWGKKSN